MFYVLSIVIVVVALFAFDFNHLVRLRASAQQSFSGIDVQLRRRADLVPNLVAAVRGYADHELLALKDMTELRSGMLTGSPEKRAEVDGAFVRAVSMVAEQYPGLRAVEAFKELQMELADTEDNVSAARRNYNANVQRYNTALRSFPTNLIAAIFGFRTMEFFEEGR